MAKLTVVSKALRGREYKLRPGVNRLGSGEAGDFCLEHDSISAIHCEIDCGEEGFTVQDRDSAAGTLLNGDLVSEARLKIGDVLVLGEVELRLADENSAANDGATEAKEAVEGLVFGERTVLCLSCELQFDRSDLKCVQAGGQSAWFCPECGRRCQTAQDWLAAQNPAGEKAFAVCVWEAFGYPINPNGAIFLVGGALFFSIIHFMGMAAPAAGMIGLLLIVLLGVVGVGYLFSYLKSVVVASSEGEKDLPDWPDLTDGRDVLEPLLQLVALLALCLGPGLVTLWTAGSEAGWAVLSLGLFYLPMGFLGVSLGDSITGGLNPALVILSILKVFGHYLAACVVWAVLLSTRWACMQLGDYLPSLIGILVTELASLYFLIVMMRVLGCMYYVNREKLRWHG